MNYENVAQESTSEWKSFSQSAYVTEPYHSWQ